MCVEKLELHGARVAIIDDLIATGGSALSAARLIQENNGFACLVVAPILVHGLSGIDKLRDANLHVETFASIDEIIELRKEMGLPPTQKKTHPARFLS